MIVYGEHDEKTLAQMHRCMEVGSAAAGVLCADGHLGYRRLPDVLAAHAGTIEIVHTLRPRGVVMAGANEFDPYKD